MILTANPKQLVIIVTSFPFLKSKHALPVVVFYRPQEGHNLRIIVLLKWYGSEHRKQVPAPLTTTTRTNFQFFQELCHSLRLSCKILAPRPHLRKSIGNGLTVI